jgi:hypothetical protein
VDLAPPRPWGVVLAVLWNVKEAVYMLALSAATVSTVLVGPSETCEHLFLWGPIGVGGLGASLLLLRGTLVVRQVMSDESGPISKFPGPVAPSKPICVPLQD